MSPWESTKRVIDYLLTRIHELETELARWRDSEHTAVGTRDERIAELEEEIDFRTGQLEEKKRRVAELEKDLIQTTRWLTSRIAELEKGGGRESAS